MFMGCSSSGVFGSAAASDMVPRSGGLSLYSVRSPMLLGTVLLMCIMISSGVVVMSVL